MPKLIDYINFISRYKIRQLFHRAKTKLTPTFYISKLYKNNIQVYDNSTHINFRQIIGFAVPDTKIKQVDRTCDSLDGNIIYLFGKTYSLDHFFNQIEFEPKYKNKLVAYELCYFQFCHDICYGIISGRIENYRVNKYLILIEKLLVQSLKLTNKHPFWYPYALSTRLINLTILYGTICFQEGISQTSKLHLVNHIYFGLRFLENNKEFDSDGNHLLKNYSSLFIGYSILGYQDKSDHYFCRLKKLVDNQLLDSGMHYECSLDYHMLIMHDLLICRLLCYEDNSKNETIDILITRMYKYARYIDENNEKPLFNDCFEPSYFSHFDLLKLVEYELYPKFDKNSCLENFNYPFEKLKNKNFIILIDKSTISPPHCPAHSHDSCLSFELWYSGAKIITDSGNSTYIESEDRQYFRSSHSHNIPNFAGISSQSVLMKSFRFGRTGQLLDYTKKSDKNDNYLSGTYMGYFNDAGDQKGFNREYIVNEEEIIIKDKVFKGSAINYLHFCPDVVLEPLEDKLYKAIKYNNIIYIIINGDVEKVEIINTKYSSEFFKIKLKKTLKISFNKNMEYNFKTTI